jgi:outer membrane protein TolC
MTTPWVSVTFMVLSIAVIFPVAVSAQAPPFEPTRTQPQQLPLSGNTSTGSVTTGQTTVASVPGVNTLSSSIQIQGGFQGSVPTGVATKDTLLLSLDEAIKRGLAYNLGMIGAQQEEHYARAQRMNALARLLPDINGVITTALEQVSLSTFGFQSAKGFSGFQFARVIGPFNFFEAGAVVNQSVIDVTAWRNYGSSKESALASKLNVRDSRDLVVLAVGGFYLQVVATAARVDSARAQVDTARALYDQAVNQNRAGVNARIDVNRSQVELQSQQLRLISFETDLETQKLSLSRLIGLPLGQVFNLTTGMQYRAADPVVLDDALHAAIENRADLQAADAQVRAAVKARRAAEGEKIPAISLNLNYAVAGINPAQSNGVFSFFGGVEFPIWRGGRIQADIAQADAVLAQRRAEYQDTYGRVDFEVRNAFLRLNAASQQVVVADSNRSLARETLVQARDRFTTGVADTIEVVQAQESVAAAEQEYISSLYAHYVAKLSLARATGNAEQGIAGLLQQQGP